MTRTNIIFFFLISTFSAGIMAEAGIMASAGIMVEESESSCTEYLALEEAGKNLLRTTEIMEILLALVSTMLLVSMLKIRKLKKKLKKFD